MKTLLSALENRSENAILVLSILVILLLLIFSTVVNNIQILAPLFILPVVLVSWYGGDKAGILLSVFSVFLILMIDTLVISPSALTPAQLYSTTSLLITCIILSVLVTNFQKVHKVEVVAAGTDDLTGAYNSRTFQLELANEILRSIRYKHVFTLIYIDIDDFKKINDTYGHATGNELLIKVVSCLKKELRKTDVVARLGGDEFACLLPETGLAEAKNAFSKASELLTSAMKNKKWPVTFSVGIVTFEDMPNDIKQAMNIADKLMYTVKNADKNNVAYEVWQGNI